MYEGLYALVAFRSLEHWALFSEWDKNAEDKFWKYSIDTFGDGGYSGCTKGFFYYANQMVLDNKVKFILKQMPTSFGKCVRADTKVLTPYGYREIKCLNIGDYICSMKDNEIVSRKILNKWETKKSQVKITTRGGTSIVVSPEHKLLTSRGYLQAQDITQDDCLYRLVDVKHFEWDNIIYIEKNNTIVDMVDIEVEETHNFIAENIVSHNSFSDSVMISFIFGIDKSEQVIKVVGNRSLPPKCTKQVYDLMCNPRFRQVFPEYQKLVVDEDKEIAPQIYSSYSMKDGTFTIKDSGRDTSFECFSKETKRDGIRGGYLFLDDIVQRKEMMRIDNHLEDIKDYDGTWKKRARDETKFRIVCGGTTYDPYDLLVTLKARYSKGKVQPSPVNKYTTLSMDESAVFVKVPKLDENDRLTFPQKTVLASVLQDRANDPDLFYAMDMQQPVPPSDTPFYWSSLRQYEYIPTNASDYCYATLDPARTGDNYVAMPIFRVVNEIDNDGIKVERHYLVDCLYLKSPMDVLYGFICDKIKKHKIIKFHIERNVDTSLKFLLDKMLKEQGIAFCDITEVYSTKKKEDRIYASETLIKNKIVFPREELYSRNSEMGQFMQHIISYRYKGAKYDDSIDAVSLYADYFISDNDRQSKTEIWYI